MLRSNFKDKCLSISAVFCAIAVPSLVFGRGMIAISLGLSLIFAIIGADHKAAYQEIKKTTSVFFLLLIGYCILSLSINIPFSLQPRLSFEAWLRTFAMLGVTYYLVTCLREKTNILLLTLSIVFFGLLLLSLSTILTLQKAHTNGLLLCLPVVIYSLSKLEKKIFFITSSVVCFMFSYVCLTTYSRASLAGVALLVLSIPTLYSLKALPKKYSFILFISLVAVIAIALGSWLPNHIYNFSADNADFAYLPVWLIDFHRQLIWKFALELAQLNPWVGFGLNASNYHPLAQMPLREYFADQYSNLDYFSATLQVLPSHPHSWLMELLIDGGVIGLLSVVICVCVIMYSSVKQYFQTGSYVLLAFIGVNLTYWGTGLLNFSFWSAWWQEAYFLMFSVCLIIFLQERKAQKQGGSAEWTR